VKDVEIQFKMFRREVDEPQDRVNNNTYFKTIIVYEEVCKGLPEVVDSYDSWYNTNPVSVSIFNYK
jgi:hypothetical protein